MIKEGSRVKIKAVGYVGSPELEGKSGTVRQLLPSGLALVEFDSGGTTHLPLDRLEPEDS